jgi:hypothetical protein
MSIRGQKHSEYRGYKLSREQRAAKARPQQSRSKTQSAICGQLQIAAETVRLII